MEMIIVHVFGCCAKNEGRELRMKEIIRCRSRPYIGTLHSIQGLKVYKYFCLKDAASNQNPDICPYHLVMASWQESKIFSKIFFIFFFKHPS